MGVLGVIFPTSVPETPFGCRNAPPASNKPRESAGTTVCTPDLCRCVILPPDLEWSSASVILHLHRRRLKYRRGTVLQPPEARTKHCAPARRQISGSSPLCFLCKPSRIHHVTCFKPDSELAVVNSHVGSYLLCREDRQAERTGRVQQKKKKRDSLEKGKQRDPGRRGGKDLYHWRRQTEGGSYQLCMKETRGRREWSTCPLGWFIGREAKRLDPMTGQPGPPPLKSRGVSAPVHMMMMCVVWALRRLAGGEDCQCVVRSMSTSQPTSCLS
ncbi:hypothetical protein J3F83DRAFT_412529 [Trichoderma novae-zelandiae]